MLDDMKSCKSKRSRVIRQIALAVAEFVLKIALLVVLVVLVVADGKERKS